MTDREAGMKDLKSGVYRHYKGGEYLLIAQAYNEADLTPVVVYRALYDTEDLGPRPTFVRPLDSFMGDEGDTPRFTWIRDHE